MIHIEFETDNAAFGESDYTVFQEVDNILSSIKVKMQDLMETAEQEYLSVNDLSILLKDSNGNTVGTCKYTWES
jgi:hypothetical protein